MGYIPTFDAAAAGPGKSHAMRRREPASAPHVGDIGSSFTTSSFTTSSFTTVASDYSDYSCSYSDISAEGVCGRGKSSMIFRTQHESLLFGPTRKSDGNLQSLSLKRQAQVKFGTVEIRLYPYILGDSPSTSMGVPLSIDWAHSPEETTSMDLEDYESRRVDDNARKSQADLRIPRLERENILLRSGRCTRTQLNLAEATLLEEKWHQEVSRKSRERQARLKGMMRTARLKGMMRTGRRISSLVRRRAKEDGLVAKHDNAASDRSLGFRRDSFGRLQDLDLSAQA